MKIGLLMPRSGIAGIWSPACDAAAMIGAAELNAEGGILGDEIELAHADCGLTVGQAVEAADFLIEVEEVDAIVGMHTSNVRDAVTSRLAGRVPYIYSAQYEGVQCGPSTVATGSIDCEILRPAVNWFVDHKAAQRFYFVGNDYIWPHLALNTTRVALAERGGHLVGHSFLPMFDADNSAVLADIARARPDVVIQLLVGQAAISFNRDFSRAGLDAKILRFGLALDETVLCGIGSAHSLNLFAGASYFASWHSKANDRYLEMYHDAFGEFAPPASSVSLGCYEGIHVVAGLARAAGRHDRTTLARMLDRPMPRSLARHALANSPAGETPPAHIAMADGVTFNVVASLRS